MWNYKPKFVIQDKVIAVLYKEQEKQGKGFVQVEKDYQGLYWELIYSTISFNVILLLLLLFQIISSKIKYVIKWEKAHNLIYMYIYIYLMSWKVQTPIVRNCKAYIWFARVILGKSSLIHHSEKKINPMRCSQKLEKNTLFGSLKKFRKQLDPFSG